MYQIDKNIPLSSPKSFPFQQMEVGDSFFIPCSDDKKIHQVRSQINNSKKRYPGNVISTRKEEGGLRVWLIYKGMK